MEGRKTAQPGTHANVKPKTSAVPPVLPPDVPQFFVPSRDPQPQYRPYIAGAATMQFVDAKAGVDVTRDVLFLSPVNDDAVGVNWDECTESEFAVSDLEKKPAPGASFAELPPAAAVARNYPKFNRDFAAYLFRTQKIDLFKSESLGRLSKVGESERDFRIRLQQAANEERDALKEALRRKYAPKLATLEERRRRAEQAMQREAEQASKQKMESMLSIGASVLGGVLGAFMGRGKAVSATNIGKAVSAVKSVNKIQKESADVDRAGETVEAISAQIADLNAQFEADVAAAQGRVDPAQEEFTPVTVRPKKTAITVNLVALVWSAE
jgi:hypothetical protein